MCYLRQFCPEFSVKFQSILMDNSGSIEPITLFQVSLKKSLHPAELELAILVKGDDVRNETKVNTCHS